MPPLRHKEPIAGATLNRDATRILTWSDDGTARLWDAATGQGLAPPLRHEDAVSSATFNRDETRILTRSWDGTARLWDISGLPRGNLIKVACGMLPDRDDPDMFSGLEERYGIAITELICGPDTPIPVWTNLMD